MVLNPHLGDCAIWHNDEIVRAVPQMGRPPIYLNHLSLSSALEKNLIQALSGAGFLEDDNFGRLRATRQAELALLADTAALKQATWLIRS